MTERPTFDPPSGTVVGWVDTDAGVLRATGIPYATAGRFEEPVPAADRTKVLEATGWAPACPQAPVVFLERVLGGDFSSLATDESCQNLSVTVPLDVQAGERLPVMDPAPLVAEQRVVAVTVTYRLGIFGYLGGRAGRPANLGLLDQMEALRWVQRNVEAFGGDPARVTVFGQSAGGDAVAHLMAVPGAASLFSRAIVQSAPLGISRGRSAMNAAMLDAAEGITAQTPVDEVVARQSAVAKTAKGSGLRAAMPFGTQYGFNPLPPEDAVDDAWDAVAAEVDLLIGCTSEEARLFVREVPVVQRVIALPVVGPLVRRGLVAALTEVVYGRSARRFARRHARAGGRVHRYVLSWSAPGNPWGAAHTVDLPMLFGDEKTWARAELVEGASWDQVQEAARAVRAVWGAFARGDDLGRDASVPGVLRCTAVR